MRGEGVTGGKLQNDHGWIDGLPFQSTLVLPLCLASISIYIHLSVYLQMYGTSCSCIFEVMSWHAATQLLLWLTTE
jgi:hypothetical protein